MARPSGRAARRSSRPDSTGALARGPSPSNAQLVTAPQAHLFQREPTWLPRRTMPLRSISLAIGRDCSCREGAPTARIQTQRGKQYRLQSSLYSLHLSSRILRHRHAPCCRGYCFSERTVLLLSRHVVWTNQYPSAFHRPSDSRGRLSHSAQPMPCFRLPIRCLERLVDKVTSGNIKRIKSLRRRPGGLCDDNPS
jgi:hypothetical protein